MKYRNLPADPSLYAVDKGISTVPVTAGRSALSPDLMLPDIIREHPETRSVFDRYGLRGCGGPFGPHESIHFFARVHGVDEKRLLFQLQDAIARVPAGGAVIPPPAPGLADTIYRRYFIAAIAVALTVGASWGAWLLWSIALSGSFRTASLNSVNAHGEAQVFGWVGLFIMGFAYQAFPRLWHTTLAAPRLAAWAFAFMIAGLLTRTIGIATAGAWSLALPLAMAGGAAQVAAVVIFIEQIGATFARSNAKLEPYVGFVLAALVWFAVSSVVSVWHTWTTLTSRTVEELIWYVATYQAPLRDLQIHGLALFMILGVSLRMLPAVFGLPAVANRRAWWALDLLATAVVGEVVLFLAYRWTGNRSLAAGLLLPWSMMAAGVGMVVLPWRPWRPFPEQDRSGKFVRAAYGWLAVSLAMLLLLPLYLAALGAGFSHAYLGATRHAITVGFVSLMIMGMAAKVVPTLNGIDTRGLSNLLGPFALVNLGCVLRVVTQVLTDWYGEFYPALGLSGTLEVAGLAWWGAGLVRIIWQGKRGLGVESAPAGSRPSRVEPGHKVADVLDWFPETEAVLLRYGFFALKQPMLRRTIARQVTLSQAATLGGIATDELVAALNDEILRRDLVPIGPSIQPVSSSGANP
jgi:hypothetical protein